MLKLISFFCPYRQCKVEHITALNSYNALTGSENSLATQTSR